MLGGAGHRPIYPFPQLLAGLEERHKLFLYGHCLAGTRVAAGARFPPFDGEGTEAAQLHTFAARQGGGDFIENGSHDQFNVAPQEMRVGGRQFGDQLRFRHGAAQPPTPERPGCQIAHAPSRLSPWNAMLLLISCKIGPIVASIARSSSVAPVRSST